MTLAYSTEFLNKVLAYGKSNTFLLNDQEFFWPTKQKHFMKKLIFNQESIFIVIKKINHIKNLLAAVITHLKNG